MHIHREDTTVRGGHVTVDCYVRTDSISDPVEEHLAAIERLADRGIVDGLDVHAWPKEVVLSEYTEHVDVVRAFRTFQEWAAQWAVHIDPSFELGVRSSSFTGEEREVLRTPALCLAVSIDGRLREVFPHRSEGRTFSVDDALETLERCASTGETPASDRRSDTGCPQCGTQLATGQGLYACEECQWTGIATASGTFHRHETDDAPVVETPDEPRNTPTR